MNTVIKKIGLSVLMILFICILPHFSSAQESYPIIFEAVQRAVLSAERPGVLNRFDSDVGDKVKKGEIIAGVSTSELALRKKRAEQTVKYLSVQVRDLSKLIKEGLATNESLAKAEMESDAAKTEIEIIKHQISKSYIRAPFSGVVARKHMQQHEWVTEGQPVVEIVDPGKLRAVANIPSYLAVTLKKGDKHTFVVHDLNISITGTVYAVAPEVDERSNTAQVIWYVDKLEKTNLLPGMKGEVRFGG
jgi:RND family efflux transporter MFP subunit